MSTSEQVTRALIAHSDGSADAARDLATLVYDRLRRLARQYMAGEKRNHTLQPTALVHEAFARMVDSKRVDWKGKTHFFFVAAREMRHVLVEHARAKRADKRGGDATRVELNDAAAMDSGISIEMLSLDEALCSLHKVSVRQSQVAEQRLFSGMTHREIAHALQISERTVRMDWQLARVWLSRELSPRGSRSSTEAETADGSV